MLLFEAWNQFDLFLLRSFPTLYVSLRNTGGNQFIVFDIRTNGGACTDGGAAFNGDRRNELAVGADKYVVADDGFEFIGTVVVAGNHARADVTIFTDFRVAYIG